MEAMNFIMQPLMNPPIERIRPADEQYYISSCSVKTQNLWGEDEIEGSCLRQQWYRIMGAPAKERARNNYLQTEVGDIFSQFLVDLCKRSGVYVTDELQASKDLTNCRIRGRIDIAVDLPTMNGNIDRVGLEIKSIRDSYYGRKNVIDHVKEEKYFPKINHAIQAAIYHDIFRSQGFSHWQVVYIDRSHGDWSDPSHKVVTLPDGRISVNGEILPFTIQDVYERYETLADYVGREEIPPRDYELTYSQEKLQLLHDRGLLGKTEQTKFKTGKLVKGDWQCKFCDYAELCWEKTNG